MVLRAWTSSLPGTEVMSIGQRSAHQVQTPGPEESLYVPASHAVHPPPPVIKSHPSGSSFQNPFAHSHFSLPEADSELGGHFMQSLDKPSDC